VIAEPGRYALNRDWDVDLPGPGTLIDIVADDVTIDFRGFTIAFGNVGTGVHISGDDVSLSNGSLDGDIEVTGVESSGARTAISNMHIRAWQPAYIQGVDSTIRDSTMSGRFGTGLLGARAVVERSVFRCGLTGGICLYVTNDSRLTGNRIGTGGDGSIVIDGDGNILVDNIIEAEKGPPVTPILVDGDHNILRNNTVLVEATGMHNTALGIDGTDNVVDGNISVTSATERSGAGMVFLQDGNFYGDNRFGGALEAVELNGTVQTDWGGNVAY
jgi:Periplasmic copper-binding protein (NosD)